jgi:adenosine deaminase
MNQAAVSQFCRTGLPKVELHAHISGSFPPSVLRELYDEKQAAAVRPASAACRDKIAALLSDAALQHVTDPTARMAHCFQVFDAVYEIVDSLAAVRRGLLAVLRVYAAEQTCYLELRTSCRALQGKTEEDYLRCVLATMDEFERGDTPRMMTKLIVSVNRGSGLVIAERAIGLAISLRAEQLAAGPAPRVVGVEFSGYCQKGVYADFAPLFQRARDAGLAVSYHVGEKPDEAELGEMLDFQPDRIGHLVYAGEANVERVARMAVPLELCITSNLLTSNGRLEDHHVAEWYQRGHPISINTDDFGIFETSMGREWELFAEALGHLKPKPVALAARPAVMAQLSQGAIAQAFCTDAEKRVLHARFGEMLQLPSAKRARE